MLWWAEGEENNQTRLSASGIGQAKDYFSHLDVFRKDEETYWSVLAPSSKYGQEPLVASLLLVCRRFFSGACPSPYPFDKLHLEPNRKLELDMFSDAVRCPVVSCGAGQTITLGIYRKAQQWRHCLSFFQQTLGRIARFSQPCYVWTTGNITTCLC